MIPPLFGESAALPDFPTAPGIVVAPSIRVRPSTLWLHGVLAVQEEVVVRRWHDALYVAIVTERGCQVQSANITRSRTYFVPPAWIDSGGGLMYLAFHVELRSLMSYPIQPEALWIHAGAREHVCTPIYLPRESPDRESPCETELDSLMAAYTHLAEEHPAAATQAFEQAFVLESVRADLDSGHLYAAACAASQSLPIAHDRDAAAGQGIAWLREDVQRRSQRLAKLAMRLAAGSEEPVLHAEQSAHLQHLSGIKQEARLAALRERPEYASVFE